MAKQKIDEKRVSNLFYDITEKIDYVYEKNKLTTKEKETLTKMLIMYIALTWKS